MVNLRREGAPNNDDRAEWAETVLSLFCSITGLDLTIERQEAVNDLMADLGHYCDRNNLRFLDIASGAIGVWDVEKREEENDETNAMYPEKMVTIELTFPN